MAAKWKASKNETLIVAASVSALMFMIGLAIFALDGNDPQNHSFPGKLFWLAPMCALPAFLLVFVSRRLLAMAMWVISMAAYCGAFAMIRDECSRGACILTNARTILKVPLIALGSFLVLPVILSILAAAMVEYAFRLERRKSLETNR